ncbi:MAG: hypothetical protein IJC01_04270 [Clostridia bacterium]|nr:hypothetical protein [Clostridia bacterium]
MQTKYKSIENFQRYVDDLISSKYILTEKKLTDLMRSLSSSKLFYKLFEHCTDDFDYDRAFQRAFQKGKGYGKGKFILPTDSRDVIALVFSLLFQISAKEIDLLKLLEEYFYVSNYDDSFRNFSMQVLVPFRTEVLKAARAMAQETTPATMSVVTKPVEKTVSDDDVKTITAMLEETFSVILQYKINDLLKADLVAVHGEFKEALYQGEPERIKIAFLAYKYATLYHRKNDVSVWKIDSILKKAGILPRVHSFF